MSRATKEQLLIEALKLIGLKRNTGFRTGKYTVFDSNTAPGHYFFVGRGGALRVGTSVKESMGVSDQFKVNLLAKAERIKARQNQA